MNQSILALLIMSIVIVSFVWNKIPVGLTALMGAITMGLVGIITYDQIFLGFVNNATIMVIGVMVLGATLFEVGVVDRISKHLVQVKFINTEKKYIFALTLLATVISAFLSNTAAVAMMIPLVNTIVMTNENFDTKNFLLPIGIASVLGGNATLVGSTPQIVAFGILTSSTNISDIPFFLLSEITVPIILIILIIYWLFGYNFNKRIFLKSHSNKEEGYFISENEIASADTKAYDHKKMQRATIIFILTVIAFIFSNLPLGLTAIIGSIACYLSGCISSKKIMEAIDWSTVLTLGGSLALANGMESSGALSLVANSLFGLFGSEPSAITIGIILIVICTLMSNLMSNTAVAAFMTPIGISLATQIGVSPLLFTILIVTGSNLAFATPISTPPITMTLMAGYKFKDYFIVGGLVGLIGIVVSVGYFVTSLALFA